MNSVEKLCREILPTVRTITVYPHIKRSAIHNPYLQLLYANTSLNVISPSFIFPLCLYAITAPHHLIVHYHWLEICDIRSILTLLIKLPPILFFHLRGGKIIWTIHNRNPHRTHFPRLNRWVQCFFAQKCDKILLHSPVFLQEIADELTVSPHKCAIVLHPRYPVTKIPVIIARQQLHHTLGISAEIPFCLMYGHIAEYKGILPIAKQWNKIASQTTLLIAGAVKKNEEAYFDKLTTIAEQTKHIHLIPRFITAEEEALLFSSCTAVLFNFQEILSSGSVVLATSYNVPIFLPKNSPAREYAPHAMLFSSEEELVAKIAKKYAP